MLTAVAIQRTTLTRVVLAITCAVCVLALAACGRDEKASAVPGVSDKEIKIGQTLPLSGPIAVVAGLSKGFDTYLEEVNAKGGVNGRTFSLSVLDDAYDPSRSASNVRKLVQQEKVFGVLTFGLGALSVRDFLEQTSTPQLALAGNSPLSDTEKYPHTRAWWPDVNWEAQVNAKWILQHLNNPRIGTVGQNNDLGVSMLGGLKKGLGDQVSKLVKTTTADAQQTDLSSQVNELRAAKVDVVVTAMTPGLAIPMMKYAASIGYKPKFFLYSVAASTAYLAPVGLSKLKGDVYTAQWLEDAAAPGVQGEAALQSYRDAVQKYGKGAKAADPYVLNGYVAAQAFVHAVEQAGDDLNQDAWLKAWDTMKSWTPPGLTPGVALASAAGGRIVSAYRVSQFDGKGWNPVSEPSSAPGTSSPTS